MLKRRPPVKYIFVTGGVLSGLGKGIAAASIGHLLSYRYKVIPIKCDGYLNIDPGTMNPIEHGEVFVLDDGGEVDMDFGHYERFLGVTCKFSWNLTMGKVYRAVLDKERRGDYLGKTVQLIPHVTDQIKAMWKKTVEEERPDVVLIEIGGTVGDLENELYLEAARQLQSEVGRNHALFVHLTYVPIPYGTNEQKSKPTQQSIAMLNARGIYPDIIIGRCKEYIADHVKKKISLYANIDAQAIISGVDVDTVYAIPLVFNKEGILNAIGKRLRIKMAPTVRRWRELVHAVSEVTPFRDDILVAICGKYTSLEDSYASVVEALKHCQAHLSCKVRIKWVDTSDCPYDQMPELLRGVDAVIVPGGFGTRGVEGKINAIRYVREHRIPFLGLCYGLQLAVIEFARDVCGITDAASTEFDKKVKSPVITILPEQLSVIEKGGTMRLGAYTAHLKKGSRVQKMYRSRQVSERHRHRFEVNPVYHDHLQKQGMVFSGISKDGTLVEFIELPDHPYFVATQAHPELKSTLFHPAPLFLGLARAASQHKHGMDR